jgi:hypothetical protein
LFPFFFAPPGDNLAKNAFPAGAAQPFAVNDADGGNARAEGGLDELLGRPYGVLDGQPVKIQGGLHPAGRGAQQVLEKAFESHRCRAPFKKSL